MSMQFKPKTAKEIAEMNIWPKGEYDFEVTNAEAAVSGPQSKNPGTEFIKLQIRIFNADGGFKFVNGILHPAMEATLYRFCEIANLTKEYESGTLTFDDCIGVSGKLRLKVKDAQGDFPAKNEIADYIVPKAEKPEVEAGKPIESDDVPF